MENIGKYEIRVVGYVEEKEKEGREGGMEVGEDYGGVWGRELGKEKFGFVWFVWEW